MYTSWCKLGRCGKENQGKGMHRAGSGPRSCNNSLYKLLLYEPGSFFLPHRNTGKEDRMFATLVIVLPSIYEVLS